MFSFSHLISSSDLQLSDIDQIIHLAGVLDQVGAARRVFPVLNDKLLCSAFFEPSTRTRLSFETAMQRLGGRVMSVEQGMVSTSTVKGESLADMGRVFSEYADVVVVRHPAPFSAQELARSSLVPVINGGDGKNQHPTQALVDLYTIFAKFKRLEGLSIGFVGDLKYGRTVHSLIDLLSYYTNNNYFFVSDPSLQLPESSLMQAQKGGGEIEQTSDFKSVLPRLDVLYVTRVQQERFERSEDYARVSDLFHINAELMMQAKSDLIVMHPLPRVNEIDPVFDADPRAYYFKQVRNGVQVRMSLLLHMLESDPMAVLAPYLGESVNFDFKTE